MTTLSQAKEFIDHTSQLSSSDTDAAEDFIQHHGVLGMKWGKRKASSSPSSSSAPKHTPVHKMLSDEDLGKVIKRLEMEKRFIDLTRQPPVQKKVSFGRNVTNRVLKMAGDAALEAGKVVLKQQIKGQLEGMLSTPSGKGSGKKGKKGKKGKTKVWKP